MDLLTAMILGIVQGVTEFLPVSSSGHVALIAMLFGEDNNVMQMASVLHLGTLAALFLYFKGDIRTLLAELIRFFYEVYLNGKTWIRTRRTGEDPSYLKLIRTNYRKMAVMLLAATPVTAVVGALLRRAAFYVSRSGLYVGAAFFITAIILIVTDMVEVRVVIPKEIPLYKALLIGAAQGIAVIPGISRAGMTMAGSTLAGLNRKTAVRFAYLLSIPAVLGGVIVELHSALTVGSLDLTFLEAALLGCLVSGVAGYLTISSFLKLIRRVSFRIFAIYCIMIGIVCIMVNFMV